MAFPEYWWIPVLVSLVFCSMGFKRFVWFMSVGYGVSSAAIGLCMFIMAALGGQLGMVYALHCIFFIIYGVRLGGFLFIREMKNAKYREKMAQAGGDMTVPVFVAFVMWILFGILYVCQSAGLVYRYFNMDAASPGTFAYIGAVIALGGLVLEWAADSQKSAQKKKDPDMPAMEGLYRLCRCPNYFGEMLFWTGAIVSGIGSLHGAQWIVALIGYIEIIIVMVSGAKRVEGRHIRNYGDKPEYNAYADSVPLLIPFVPLYHMTSPEKIAKEEAAKKAKKEKKKG